MTDAKKFDKRLREMDIEELIDQLWHCGCDPHYFALWSAVMIELERRIEEGEL